MKLRLQVLTTVILCLGLACATAPTAPDHPSVPVESSGPGVVVEEVAPGSALDKAGLRPGDLLLSWERPPDRGRGEIRTAFDWRWVQAEQAPRGTLWLHGTRNDAPLLVEVPRGLWDARVRPRLAADQLRIYSEGRLRIEAGDLEGGVALWRQLAEREEPPASPELKSWLLLQISQAWSKGRQGDPARSTLQAALADAPDVHTRVVLLEALGESFESAGRLVDAESSFRAALEASEAAWGDSLQVAGTLARLGEVLRLRNRLDEAEKLLARSLEIRQRHAPEGLEVADSLNRLMGVTWVRGDLETMSEHARRALAIEEQWSPDGPEMARTLTSVALVATQHGRFEEAREVFQRALAIYERREPESQAVAGILNSLAVVARACGDVETAVELHQRSLAIWARLAPESIGVARNLANLGNLAQERGEPIQAEELYRRSLRIWEKIAPEGLGVATIFDDLGSLARERGDLDESWKLHHRALDIQERLAPGSLHTAPTLMKLGMVAEARGDLSLALDLYQRALAVNVRLAPGTIEEAQPLLQLGLLERRRGRLDQAAQYLLQAVEALENQAGNLGGTQDLQAKFRARNEEIYRHAIEVELERGRAEPAFHLLERSRARSFLALLSERDLTFSGELPDALERSRRDNALQYDKTLRRLAGWSPAAGEAEREALDRELSRLRQERDEIAAEIRKASPRLAALRQPQPLDLAAARQILDPGTLALSYSVGKDQTALFAVTREGGLRIEILKVGEERLRQDIESFLERIQSQEVPVDLSRSLYRTLIGPVAGLVERSERVLILPDGPLHRLPFGALQRDTKDGGQYLIEWKPLHTTLSMTVYGTLRASDRAPSSPATPTVVAFGDPRYPRHPATNGETRDLILRSPGLRSFDWTALPYSRREVESIAAVYPGARLYLGEDATEERAKTGARDARILHFATHGYLDDQAPLDSALVLTIPEDLASGRDNGLLQVWEIFESVRLDADLVVLSGCDTALGRELSGEGLIGLTRAFQYAGARSVVASLWSVTDQVTAELMVRFHRHLAAGLSKAEALRAAQIGLIRQPIQITTAQGQTLEMDVSSPFFWAAFQLFGDWR